MKKASTAQANYLSFIQAIFGRKLRTKVEVLVKDTNHIQPTTKPHSKARYKTETAFNQPTTKNNPPYKGA